MDNVVSPRQVAAAQNWLVQSIEVCSGKGSAAFYQPFNGWAPAYPETTGYLIPTLLDIAEKTGNPQMTGYALSCADWLCSIQLKDGHFPGGVGGKLPPNVFDTGQIVLGLTAAILKMNCDHYHEALRLAVDRLLDILETDGSWRQDSYIKGYVPSYYTRVVWALLLADGILELQYLRPKMENALEYYAQQITPELNVKNWSFAPGEPAFSHTIAYTIRGFFESGILLINEKYIALAEKIAEKLIELLEENGRLAGSYDENWKGDYSYICVPGHFQLVIIFNKLFQRTGKELYQKWAQNLFVRAQRAQSQIPIKGIKGGFPGSDPFWGKYQRAKWLNWGVKFYLDAAYSF